MYPQCFLSGAQIDFLFHKLHDLLVMCPTYTDFLLYFCYFVSEVEHLFPQPKLVSHKTGTVFLTRWNTPPESTTVLSCELPT